MAAAKTILLIDDDPEVLAALRAGLERQGYRVVTASDGNQGLAAAERDGPDLVVVDMMMPRRSGLLVLEKLKKRPGGGPPMIMITANEGSRQRAYAEYLGVVEYIRKPFAMEKLLEAVHKGLADQPPPEEGKADEQFDRPVLFARQQAQGSPVVRDGRDADSLIEQVGRDVIRVRHVMDAHPRAYLFVAVQMPVEGAPHGARGKERREQQRQQKGQRYQPLLPCESSHLR